MPLFSRFGAWFRPLAMCVGFAGILVAAFVTPATSGFPAPWSALAVLSTALILAFPWQPRRFAALNPLTNPVSGYIGDISYSLYLWHFPAIILVTEGFRGLPGQGTPIPAIVAIAVSFVLAALSYRFVEEPVRKSSWLEPGKRRSASSVQRLRVVGLGALTIVSCFAVVAAFAVNRAGSAQAVDNTPSAGATATAPDTTANQGGETGAAKTELQSKLSAALQATSWPQLDTDPGDPQRPAARSALRRVLLLQIQAGILHLRRPLRPENGGARRRLDRGSLSSRARRGLRSGRVEARNRCVLRLPVHRPASGRQSCGSRRLREAEECRSRACHIDQSRPRHRCEHLPPQ